MQKIVIDEEFRLLLPKLDKVTFELLEKNIIEYGIRDPLVVWNDILIDGYNRYTICKKHDLPFTTVSMEFSSRDEVLHWIIENQVSRRNLTAVELSHFRGLYFNAAKRISGSSNQYTKKSEIPQSEGKQNTIYTAIEVGKRFNVSKATIERDAKVAAALSVIAKISPDAKQKILSGEVPVDRSKLQRLSIAPADEVKEVVRQINDGTYNRNDYRIKKASGPAQEQTPPYEYQPPLSNDYPPSSVFPKDKTHFDTIISRVRNDLIFTVNLLTIQKNAIELEMTLRTLINNLEDVCNTI